MIFFSRKLEEKSSKLTARSEQTLGSKQIKVPQSNSFLVGFGNSNKPGT